MTSNQIVTTDLYSLLYTDRSNSTNFASTTEPKPSQASSSNSPLAKTDPHLLSLPLELRHLIYEAVLWISTITIISDNPLYKRNQGILTPLSATNVQLKNEIRGWLFEGSDGIHGRIWVGYDTSSPWKVMDIDADDKSMPSMGAFNRHTTTVILEERPGEVELMTPPLNLGNWVQIHINDHRKDPESDCCKNLRPEGPPRLEECVGFSEEMKRALMGKRRLKRCGKGKDIDSLFFKGLGEVEDYLTWKGRGMRRVRWGFDREGDVDEEELEQED